MKFNNILAISSLLLIMLICIGAASAIDDSSDGNNLTSDSSISQLDLEGESVLTSDSQASELGLSGESVVTSDSQASELGLSGESAVTSDSQASELELSEGSDNDLSASNDDSTLTATTWVVDEVASSNNEMNNPTIQTAINNAAAGDTIIINGKNYEHCHFIINKKLTIISNVGTTMAPCSSTATSNYQGIFYISSKASGTVISGFTINGGSMGFNTDAYGVYVKGASDVTIKNCNISTSTSADDIRLLNTKNVVIENVTLLEANNGVKAVNSENFVLRTSVLDNSNIGANIINSTKITITSNNISNNKDSGISFAGSSSNMTVIYNNITENGNGVSITAPNYVYILGNYIAFNDENGVYVDNEITLVEIKGNFFNQNTNWEIFNDFHVQTDAFKNKGHKLEIISNNYMINYGSGSGDIDRPVWTQIYEYRSGSGNYNYDAENDKYVYVGSGGDYYGHQGIMFIQGTFEINEYMYCPNIYYAPRKIWSSADPSLELLIGEITQIKKGIYSISIVDSSGNVASELCSVPVTFYLNKVGTISTPQEGDVYRTVMMQNGTATVRFYQDEFLETGNIVTAVFPTPGTNFDSKVSKTFAVDDDYIPGIPSNTTIKMSGLTTYPNSNQELTATLTDSNGNPIAGETLKFTINSKTTSVSTDKNGQAKIKISESKEGTYVLNAIYAGDGDIDYYGTSSQATVVVKKTGAKIASSNLNMIPKRAEYYSVTLKDASGNVLANQKVTFKVNGKTYSKYTNSKGVAKVKLKFSKNKKTYKIKITYAGNNKYKAVSKTNKILVKYSSKKAKLTAPSVTIPPKTAKYYTVTLKDANGKAIKKQKVTVRINGKKYTKKTNSKGKIKIKVKFSKLKTYNVKAAYKGSKIYKKASATGKIKVAKTATKITSPAVSMLPKESKTYTVTLKAGNKALAKQKLTIKVNGKTYSKTTNAKGQASVSLSFASENTYSVNVAYKGTGIYKASKATGKITVAKIASQIESYDRTYSNDSSKAYQITLKDKSGNGISNQAVSFTLNSQSYSKTTDSNGKITLDLNDLFENATVTINYAGSDKYKPASKTNKITVLNKSNIVFVDGGLPSSEIQSILDSANEGCDVEFLGSSYSNIALKVNKALNIYSSNNASLNAQKNVPVIEILSDNVNITDLIINGNMGDAIAIRNAQNVNIHDNVISNNLDYSRKNSFNASEVDLFGCGIGITNSSNIHLSNNVVSSFESAVFAQDSSDILIANSTLKENNYGIKYGFGVANTEISGNKIFDSIGLYTMAEPEGPTGYGIFLNNSAVNVTINKNNIYNNFIGISIDANYSTGINITQNKICDQVLEGIRFNAGYDLAENAIEPYVSDNAIYRNARGPSLMILGEMSANPFGIYGPGEFDDSKKLKIGTNWYGTNKIVTWQNGTENMGYGTMCPRINTTEIKFTDIEYEDGSYKVVFYKNDEIASDLPEFDMYATLNRGTDKEVEVVFDVVNGVGTFSFNPENYDSSGNLIEISVGSLINSTSRVFKVTYSYEVPESEIPA